MRNSFSAAILFLIASLVPAPSAWSQIENVTMRVDGLACPFCAYGLEKRLKKVPGVSEIEIRVDDAVVILEGKEEESISIDRLKPAVKDAGFTAREMDATAVGSVATVNDRRVLQIGGGDTELLLEDNSALQELLADLPGSNRVRLKGQLSESTPKGRQAHRFTLTVKTFEILDAATE